MGSFGVKDSVCLDLNVEQRSASFGFSITQSNKMIPLKLRKFNRDLKANWGHVTLQISNVDSLLYISCLEIFGRFSPFSKQNTLELFLLLVR